MKGLKMVHALFLPATYPAACRRYVQDDFLPSSACCVQLMIGVLTN
jgi:hypothetical protein